MFIVTLRFTAENTRAKEWMEAHNQWIQQGIEDGVFLIVGSLTNNQGGVIVTATVDQDSLQSRIAQDPLVREGIVRSETVEVTPAKMREGLQQFIG